MAKMNLSNLTSCPGLYCGISDNSGQCGPCLRGKRVFTGGSSICVDCTKLAGLYQWMYLGFMALLPIVLCSYFIWKQKHTIRESRRLWAFYICCQSEFLLSGLLTILIYEPKGHFSLLHCPVLQLSDWYPLFFNPKPDLVTPIYCTHEVVYPLYTIVLIYYGFSTLLNIVFHPLLIIFLIKDQSWFITLYYLLYTYPILSIIHIIFGGLLYSSYPYIILILSIVHSSYSFAHMFDHYTNEKKILTDTWTIPQNLLPVVSYWLLHFYGIVALTELKEPALYGPLMILVPLPYFFFAISIRFTDPKLLTIVT